ncbi:MAG: IucA/IucC family siderophore biosynthesis protein [Aliivibrio sp.]|uniref:IucA/IucC family protein n=1 Tax=Aliivibrio sp. TaxID=1872443 RepID=UPI001A5AF6A8|nr:IucA/IucC family siderophore biosynthesis protein [Aliivibrio sp.]
MDQIALHSYWSAANHNMVGKLISELSYEQAFKIEEHNTEFLLSLGDDIQYSFIGKRNIWGQIVIDSTSLIRKEREVSSEVLAAQFMRDIQSIIGITDGALAEHFEDLNATLLGDCKLALRKVNMTAKELAFLSCERQQLLFDGHPKFAFNKGRRGWGSDDLAMYAPEAERAFQLSWIAVHDSIMQKATNHKVDWKQLVRSAVDEAELHKMEANLSAFNIDISDYTLVPVHPWQWRQKLSILFVREMAEKTLIYLGEFGDEFLPQLSIRTLSNTSRPCGYDIKLPLSIMNTSCYRGIPGRYILAGPVASDWLDSIFRSDALFIDKNAEILQEPAAGFVAQSDYKLLADAPYRYHELLGVIWRESAQSKLAENETAILMAALMESDVSGRSLISEYISASGLSIEEWLDKLFDAVVIPFYHLLCKYGVSLIAHGQNVTLVMEDAQPKRILLKDFQGDMRLVESSIPEQETLSDLVKDVTVTLPEDLIVHDLQTGHFVTVLRFISPLVEKLGLPEIEFYRLLALRIKAYVKDNPAYQERFERLDLFKPRILRIGLNLAKFRHNTDSSASRMLPDMDEQVDNPLYMALNK